MELLELENIWKECNREIAGNTRVNREILRRMLLAKPEKRINWMKIWSGFNLLTPLILFILITVTNYQFYITPKFYIGLSLFLPAYIAVYILDLKYFLLIRRFDFSDTALSIKKRIAELEKCKIKATQVRYILTPVLIFGILLMIIRNFIFNTEFLIMILLMVVVMIVSASYTFKYSIRERFRLLNKEIEEIEELEKG